MDCGIVKQNCIGSWVILALSDSGLGWTGRRWVAQTNGLGLDEPLLDFSDHISAASYAAANRIDVRIVGPMVREYSPDSGALGSGSV